MSENNQSRTIPDDPTPEQSLKNFVNNSMLNRYDVIAQLDIWLDQIKSDRLNIKLSTDGTRSLVKTIRDMRGYVMNNSHLPDIVPSITGTRYRYVLDWFHDGLQLGIERFDEEDLFDESGETIPRVYEANEVDAPENDHEPDEDTPDDEPRYLMAHKSAVSLRTVDAYAKHNQVKPATVRKWISRGRIKSIKLDNQTLIPAIQYTPDAYRNGSGTTFRFRSIDQAPEELAKIDPALTGRILDLMIRPIISCDGIPEGHEFLCVTLNDKKGSVTTGKLDEKQTTRLLEILYNTENIRSSSDNYYHSPFRDEKPARHARLLPITADHAARSKAYKASAVLTGNYERPNPESNKELDPAAMLEIKIQTGVEKDIIFKGRLCRYDRTEEQRLLHAIFGMPETILDITDAIQAAGLSKDIKYSYPWNKLVLLIDDIMCDRSDAVMEHVPTAISFLPKFVRYCLGIDPDLILIKRQRHDEIDKICLDAGFDHAGKFVYAYNRSANIFRCFKTQAEPDADSSNSGSNGATPNEPDAEPDESDTGENK